MYGRVLVQYEGFLRERALVCSGLKHHYVRWVGDFLEFAAQERLNGRRAGFEATLARFIKRLEEKADRPGWQVGQAKNAVRILIVQYRVAFGSVPSGQDGAWSLGTG